MGKIDTFEKQLIQYGMSDDDFEEYKKLLKRVRGNFAKLQHCCNTAAKFPSERIEQAIRLINYGLDMFQSGWFSVYLSYTNIAELYETAHRYQEAYDSYYKLFDVVNGTNNNVREELYGKLCILRLYIDNFQYSSELENLYSNYDKIDEFNKRSFDYKFKRAIIQMVINKHHKHDDIVKELYQQAIHLQRTYKIDFMMTPEINEFLQEIAKEYSIEDDAMCKSVYKTMMYQYRDELLENGFMEPTKQNLYLKEWRFFKRGTELTAFIINMKELDEAIEIAYGWASTAFTLCRGDENSLIERGVWTDDINIRNQIIISENYNNDEDYKIKGMYDKYYQVEKEELLECSRKMRKELFDKIDVRLKPLGFKKKGNAWKKNLEGEFYLLFEAQKSSFADEYYFNVTVDTDNRKFAEACFYTRLYPEQLCPLNWQLYPEDKFIEFLDNDVVTFLSHIINTPLLELGKEKMIWKDCWCKRDNCTTCWIEKKMRHIENVQ